MAEEFDPQRSRAKRPLPLWGDALMADTQHLETDEFGAYLRLLIAMWRQPGCDLPDDEKVLARICGVSRRLWRARIAGAVMPFLQRRDGRVWQRRLRMEAGFIEHHVASQSKRKKGKTANREPESGGTMIPSLTQKDGLMVSQNATLVDSQLEAEKSRKPLETNKPGTTADDPGKIPGGILPTTYIDSTTVGTDVPTVVLSSGGGGGRARGDPTSAPADADALHAELLAIAGHELDGAIPKYWMPPAATVEVWRWVTDLGLTPAEVCKVAREMQARAPGPANGPRAYDAAIRHYASVKSAQPKEINHAARSTGTAAERARYDHAVTEAQRALREGRITSIVAGEFAPGASRTR